METTGNSFRTRGCVAEPACDWLACLIDLKGHGAENVTTNDNSIYQSVYGPPGPGTLTGHRGRSHLNETQPPDAYRCLLPVLQPLVKA